MRRLVVAVTLLIASAAGAAPALAADTAAPVVLGSCAATVQAAPGTQIALSPDAVLQPVVGVLAQLDPLGVLVPPFETLWRALPAIPIGTAPAAIPGSAIADAVIGRLRALPLLGPVIDVLVGPVRSVLSLTCGVLVQPSPSPSSPSSPPSTGSPPQVPGGTPADPARPSGTPPNGGGTISVPTPAPGGTPSVLDYPSLFDPGGLPGPGVPPDGVAFDYGAVPQAGPVKVDPQAVDATLTPGRAEAMAVRESRPIGLPILLATLLFTLVATQLVRVWLLRGPGRGRSHPLG
ncbi:hypothetical protein ORV05_31825 [Amycolatopsis cynarae]|uniref:Uncharacterized protein n=1 Tax=Amycolatopsis cynarae TaxID=2995223 RepID=A0ABY7AZH7_9PSEU|nr:hypothetical protein [Amycolatopsis sp. HUAS 11-8]WAL65430.1 hypothetical protein ORV05_31825 [Amycolatopsis sp. HUAS 11-8]